MSEPDEAMVEAVASAVDLCVDDWNGEPWSMAQEVARAVLSVPVVRDALARDAQVREIVEATAAEVRNPQPGSPPGAYIFAEGMVDVFGLYAPTPGDRDDSEEQR